MHLVQVTVCQDVSAGRLGPTPTLLLLHLPTFLRKILNSARPGVGIH